MTARGGVPRFLLSEDQLDSTDRAADPIICFFRDDANFKSKNFLFGLLPFIGSLNRAAVLRFIQKWLMLMLAVALTFFSLFIISIEVCIIFGRSRQLNFFAHVSARIANPT